ncbi:MAG: hypothetical protein AAF404_05640 [Pseudomonadota bacterium]
MKTAIQAGFGVLADHQGNIEPPDLVDDTGARSMLAVSKKTLSILVAAAFLTACSSDDDDATTSFLGDTVTVANTFEDATLTAGAQVIYGLSDPTAVSDPEVELPNFINFYDMDFAANTLVMTLVNNSDAADLVLPEGRFDRYYIGFAANTVASVTLDGADALNEFATVSVLPAGFSLEAVDSFNTGIVLPIDFAQGGLLVELGAGTDLTNTGVTVKVNFE